MHSGRKHCGGGGHSQVHWYHVVHGRVYDNDNECLAKRVLIHLLPATTYRFISQKIYP